ncbi:NADH:flavin oxidoreductase [Heliobacterium gestii]|uniref:NADH:flavin oxidoreductase n=1 Tax=Heliomicrobium gestii TaxID=2699 RepID=A0A845LHH7_HELGE|nr:NADH:flavin oxidoreductase [Heliomicrobium gestii]MBM7868279.1 2,4-dienoyl-CoA reductase-like NADH-dependent reductase (Old Yellow Enzyme family) [Heliomicrobium gestii]MZP44470.1 NADH:flavin oxidoreductase [Heliomicrobium gestii]
MKSLFDPTTLAGMQLKNRFIRSATHDGVADASGHMTDALLQIYENLAKGGVGAMITGLAYVSDLEQPITGQMGIYDDSFIDDYKGLTETVHRYDAKIILQIACMGSQTFPAHGKIMWGPSAVEDLFYKTTPQEMSVEDIRLAQRAFADAALRAKQAGFDGVQIHGAHGYLLSKFLTPHYNRRTDGYGGGIENRSRMVIETYQAIREKVGPEYPVLTKINGDDFMDQGMTFSESRYVCERLAELGIDAIEISGGLGSSRPNEGTVRTITTEQESYFRSYAAQVAEEIDVPVILVGGNRNVAALTDLINQTAIEYISLCRPLIRESDLVNRWQSGDVTSPLCVSCNKCFRRGGTVCVFHRKKKGLS